MSFWKDIWHAIKGDEDADEVRELAPEEELAEPVVTPPAAVAKLLALKGQLPSDFPARAQLHNAGINTYGQLAKISDPSEVVGIGPSLAWKIRGRLVIDLKNNQG